MYIKVLLIEKNEYDTSNIKSSDGKEFNFFHIKNDNNLKEELSKFSPHIILTFDSQNIENIRLHDKEKWLNLSIKTPPLEIGEEIIKKYFSLLNDNKNTLFSVITPLYKSSIYKLNRLYNSLIEQTYNNWEWIVFDDSPIEHLESYNYINNLSKLDNRIFLYRRNKSSGIIGEVKKVAFSLGTGDILVEVDHDDELVNTCLENLLIGYNYSDEIGFVYGHTCEMFEDSNDIMYYGDNWGMGYGGYSNFIYNNKNYKVAIAPNINSKTIRHIVGVPNHVRSWRKSTYHQIGGHNKNLHVADDYELLIRTFLNTKMVKIDAFTYIQYFEKNSTNTQFNRNAEIQRITHYTSKFYNEKIHSRFLDLNISDFSYNNENIINPEKEEYANIIISENLLKNNFKKMTEQTENKKTKKAFFDVGANDGRSSIEIAQNMLDVNFYAFEPTTEMCEKILEKSKNLNNYFLIPKAVSNFNGAAKFNVVDVELDNGENFGCSSLLEFSEKSKFGSPSYEWFYNGKDGAGRTDFVVTKVIEVEVITLDKFIDENEITEIVYLHIDTQGSDLNVLKGLGDKISIVKAGQMEAATKENILYNGQNMEKDCIQFLKQNGFEIISIENIDPSGNEVNIYFKSTQENKYAYSRVYDIPSTIQYKKTEHYSNLLEWIIKLTNCQSYLELGVEYSTTIAKIKNLVKKCVGVDINHTPNAENIDFNLMSTDEFFSINTDTYDIIFIDANHNFEQVKKDFDNSLKFLNKFGIIILHDTDPIIPELLSSNHCDDAYKIINYISKNITLDIITLPIQETGMSLVMRKNDKRLNEFKNNLIK